MASAQLSTSFSDIEIVAQDGQFSGGWIAGFTRDTPKPKRENSSCKRANIEVWEVESSSEEFLRSNGIRADYVGMETRAPEIELAEVKQQRPVVLARVLMVAVIVGFIGLLIYVYAFWESPFVCESPQVYEAFLQRCVDLEDSTILPTG